MEQQPVPEWYFNLIQYYLLPLTQVIFQLGLVVILFLALRELRRLVDYLEPYDFEDDELEDDMDESSEDEELADANGDPARGNPAQNK